MATGFIREIIETIISVYQVDYPDLKRNRDNIIGQALGEEQRFKKILNRVELYKQDLEMAIKHNLVKKIHNIPILSSPGVASGRYVSENYQSYGVPYDLAQEVVREMKLKFDKQGFEAAQKSHQQVSRTSQNKKFQGGLASQGAIETRYHTANHLLLAALRKVLGGHVIQKGSNINAKRLRFDFSHSEKMTPEQIKKVEDLVNQKIKENIPVKMEEMPLDEAKAQGATGVFDERYGDKVKVYSIGSFSKEICGGPHIKKTGEIGRFKIIKEQSSSAGVRRIRAKI
jgi:alanyl-tRNA synthetase